MPVDRFSVPLLAWFDIHARALPWRQHRQKGVPPDPYPVWLAEVMAQQTGVLVAGRYWRRFMERWPGVVALAAAPEEEVLREWAGLGYYARARNLSAAARVVALRGAFPCTPEGLRALPGVGAYTAAAIAAIAFNARVAAVDANVCRVVARLFALPMPAPALGSAVAALLEPFVPADRPGDFAEALMDLGATICTPRNPDCGRCPLAALCAGHRQGAAAAFPVKPPRKARPVKRGTAWWIGHGDEVALVRRPPGGLLGGMLALPGSGWAAGAPEDEVAVLPFAGGWRLLPGRIRHVFTHFTLELSVASVVVQDRLQAVGQSPLLWTRRQALASAGLPTLYLRAAELALAQEPSDR